MVGVFSNYLRLGKIHGFYGRRILAYYIGLMIRLFCKDRIVEIGSCGIFGFGEAECQRIGIDNLCIHEPMPLKHEYQ